MTVTARFVACKWQENATLRKHPVVMYEHSAATYDLLNRAAGKNYAVEVDRITELARERAPQATSLLDVACGTGQHLAQLRTRFDVVGIDADPAMLDIARHLLPDVELHLGDMRNFDLGRSFDVVTCLFSAIGYMLDDDGLHAAVQAMARHLSPGGLLIVEPWFHPEAWIVGHVEALATHDGHLAVCRLSRSSRQDHLSHIDFHVAVATADGLDAFDEPHVLALWPVDAYVRAFEDAGLRVEHDPEGLTGRGLFLGQRT